MIISTKFEQSRRYPCDILLENPDASGYHNEDTSGKAVRDLSSSFRRVSRCSLSPYQQSVDFVRHRIHSGGFQADALLFISVFGSAKAGIHRGKLGGGLKSTASRGEGGRQAE